MKKDLIQDFTLRISNANRSELVVIKFDMFDEYVSSALAALDDNNVDLWKSEVRHAINVIESFKNTLDFKYEISANLFLLYHYSETLCYKALSLKKKEFLEEAKSVMARLAGSFVEVAKTDDSPALMGHSEQVVAGMTYGKGSVYEGVVGAEPNRGFWA